MRSCTWQPPPLLFSRRIIYHRHCIHNCQFRREIYQNVVEKFFFIEFFLSRNKPVDYVKAVGYYK